MTDAKTTLDKVLTVLGMQAPAVELEVETPAVELAEPEAPAVPEEEAPKAEEAPVEEKMAVEDLIAALDAKISAIADMVASLVAEEKSEVEEAPAAPVEAPVEVPMAAQTQLSEAKPFNGAPVEDKKVDAIYKGKTAGTLGSVYSKLF